MLLIHLPFRITYFHIHIFFRIKLTINMKMVRLIYTIHFFLLFVVVQLSMCEAENGMDTQFSASKWENKCTNKNHNNFNSFFVHFFRPKFHSLTFDLISNVCLFAFSLQFFFILLKHGGEHRWQTWEAIGKRDTHCVEKVTKINVIVAVSMINGKQCNVRTHVRNQNKPFLVFGKIPFSHFQ